MISPTIIVVTFSPPSAAPRAHQRRMRSRSFTSLEGTTFKVRKNHWSPWKEVRQRNALDQPHSSYRTDLTPPHTTHSTHVYNYVFSVQFADARKSNQPHTTSHQTPDLPWGVDGAQPFRRRASRHDDGRVMLTFKPVSSSLQGTYNPVLV